MHSETTEGGGRNKEMEVHNQRLKVHEIVNLSKVTERNM